MPRPNSSIPRAAHLSRTGILLSRWVRTGSWLTLSFAPIASPAAPRIWSSPRASWPPSVVLRAFSWSRTRIRRSWPGSPTRSFISVPTPGLWRNRSVQSPSSLPRTVNTLRSDQLHRGGSVYGFQWRVPIILLTGRGVEEHPNPTPFEGTSWRSESSDSGGASGRRNYRSLSNAVAPFKNDLVPERDGQIVLPSQGPESPKSL